MTAAKTYLLIKGAEVVAGYGWPMHREFVYQVAYIYALNPLSSSASKTTINNLISMGIGALMIAGTWLSYKIGFESLLQRISKDYATPPYSQVFQWISASTFLSMGAEVVSKEMVLAGFGPRATTSKTAKIVMLLQGASIQYGVAQLLNRHGFSFSDGYITLSFAMLGKNIVDIISAKE